MNNKTKYSIQLGLRITAFLLIATSIFMRLLFINESFESAMVESGIVKSWISAFWINLVFTALCIFWSFNLLLGSLLKSNRIFNLIMVGILTINFIMTAPLNFHFGYPLFFLEGRLTSGVGLACLTLIITYLSFFDPLKEQEFLGPKIRIPFAVLIGLIYPFIYPYDFDKLLPSDYKYVALTVNENWDSITNNIEKIDAVDSRNVNLIFVSASCGHCNELAKKIAIIQDNNPELKNNFAFVFWEMEEAGNSKEQIEKFISSNEVRNNTTVTPSEVYNTVGGSFPVIINFKDGKIHEEYRGKDITYYLYDYLQK